MGPVGPLSFSLTTAEALASPPSSSTSPPSIDCAVLFLTEEAAATQSLDLSIFHPLLTSSSLSLTPSAWQDFGGKFKQTLHLYPSPTSTIPRLLLIGLGKAKDVQPSTIRSVTHTLLTHLKLRRVKCAALALPIDLNPSLTPSALLDLITRIAVLSNHTFSRYLTKKKEGDAKLHTVDLLHFVVPSSFPSPPPAPLQSSITQAQTIAESVVMARELVNDRGDVITPSALEAFAVELGRANGLTVRVVKGEQLTEEGLTLISAVGQGSKEGEGGRIVVLEYTGDEERKEERVALVGKAITFDTGGLNLKSTGNIEDVG